MIKLEFTGTLTAINVIAFKNKKGGRWKEKRVSLQSDR